MIYFDGYVKTSQIFCKILCSGLKIFKENTDPLYWMLFSKATENFLFTQQDKFDRF